jgi:protein dithiol:quinone oxidoreductase
MNILSPRLLMALIGLACASSVVIAVSAQHLWEMQPCPWCILQRMIFIVIALLSLLAAAQPIHGLRRVLAALVVPLAGCGVAAALWQHFVAAQSSSCALTLADRIITAVSLDQRWPEVFEVRASCADAAVNLAGIPFEFWSLALFALVGVLALACALAAPRHARH